MAIKITVSDANRDGAGINFSSYLSNFARTFEDATGRGDFSGKVSGAMTPDDPLAAPGYMTTDSEDEGGNSVIFGASGKFIYDFYNGHVISGKIKSITFGTDTEASVIDSSSTLYTNSKDIVISGFTPFTSTSEDGEVLGDILKVNTNGLNSLYAFLKSDSIIFTGSTGSDTFTGYDKADTINGGRGNDRLDGGKGNDRIDGDAGNDRLYGDLGNDTVYGDSGNDYIYGEAGNDRLTGGSGIDRMFGGDGTDILGGDADGDYVYGQGGNDRLNGGAGNDRLDGGAGNDRIDGDTGNDRLIGGAGADTFFFAKGDGYDRIADFQAGAAGKDVIQFSKNLFDSYTDMLSNAVDTANGVMIYYTDGKVLLEDIEIADLNKYDFDIL